MTATERVAGQRGRRRIRIRLAGGPVSIWVGGAITLILLVIAVVSLGYVPHDPNAVMPASRLLGSGAPGHLLGTDTLGRDVFSELMVGVRTSMQVGAAGAFTGLLVGAAAGLVAASRRGIVDEVLMRGADIMLAIPGIVLALVLAATMGSGAMSTTVALAVIFTPSVARVVRASAMRVLAEDFVLAARLYGRGERFIVIRHVVPNLASVLIVQFTLFFAWGVLIEAGLSYLGAGVQRPSISLGTMLREAQDQLGVTSILTFWSGLTIAVMVLGLNLLGDGLRDRLDPKTGTARL